MIYEGEEFVAIRCWSCKALYFLPGPLWVAAKHKETIAFHCPYGHAGHYPAGETETDKLRRERDRLVQEQARLTEEIGAAHKRAKAAERKTARLVKRAANGVCPCCNRSFTDLKRHMDTKHPDVAVLPKRPARVSS